METLARPLDKAPAQPAISAHLAARIQREFTTRWDTLWSGRSLLHGRDAGPDAVRLNGNDYLSLTGHPDIVRAQTEAIKTDAEFVIQSSVFLLDEHPARQLELKLAALLGKEDGLICQSGYSANLGLLQSIADQHTVIYMDSLAHTSLWEGARRAGAKKPRKRQHAVCPGGACLPRNRPSGLRRHECQILAPARGGIPWRKDRADEPYDRDGARSVIRDAVDIPPGIAIRRHGHVKARSFQIASAAAASGFSTKRRSGWV